MLSQALHQAQVELGLKIIALWQGKVYSRSLPRFSNVVTEWLYFFLLCLSYIVVQSRYSWRSFSLLFIISFDCSWLNTCSRLYFVFSLYGFLFSSRAGHSSTKCCSFSGPPLQSLHVGSTSCELNFALLACSLSVPVSSFAFTIAFCEAKGECLLPVQTWWGTLLGFSCNCRYFRVDFSLTSLFVLLFQNSAIPCLHFIFQYSTCLMLRMFLSRNSGHGRSYLWSIFLTLINQLLLYVVCFNR